MIAKITALSPTGWNITFETKHMELDALLAELPAIEARLEEAGFDTVSCQPSAPVTVTVAAPAAPTANSFAARELTCELLDKKPYWKIIGAPPFHKFGMRVWPEVLEAAGIEVEKIDIRQGLDLTGWTAHWEARSGKDDRQTKVVVGLSK